MIIKGSRTIVPREKLPPTPKLTITLTGGQFSSGGGGGAIVQTPTWVSIKYLFMETTIHDFKLYSLSLQLENIK